jgi:hypothetical protein
MAGEFKKRVNLTRRRITGPLTCAAPPATSPERSQDGVQQIPGKVQRPSMSNELAAMMRMPMLWHVQRPSTNRDTDTDTDMTSVNKIQTRLAMGLFGAPSKFDYPLQAECHCRRSSVSNAAYTFFARRCVCAIHFLMPRWYDTPLYWESMLHAI